MNYALNVVNKIGNVAQNGQASMTSPTGMSDFWGWGCESLFGNFLV
jgi:hypothetical protein